MHKLIKETIRCAWVSTDTPTFQLFFEFKLPTGVFAKLEVHPQDDVQNIIAAQTGATRDGVIVQLSEDESLRALDLVFGESDDGTNGS